MEPGQQWKDQWDAENPKKQGGLAGVKDELKTAGKELTQLAGFASRAVTGNPLTGPLWKKALGDKPKTFNGTTMYNPDAGIKDWAKDTAITAALLYGGKGGGAKTGGPKFTPPKVEATPPKGPKFFDDPFTPRTGGSTTSGYPRTGGTSSGPSRGGSSGKSSSMPDASTSGVAGTKTKTKTQTPWAPEYSPAKAQPLPEILPRTKPAVKPSAKPALKPAEKPNVKAEVKTEPKVSTKEETKTSPKEETKGKSKATERTKNFARAAAAASLLGVKDGKGDGPWTASAIV
jgi:hypothetical protein